MPQIMKWNDECQRKDSFKCAEKRGIVYQTGHSWRWQQLSFQKFGVIRHIQLIRGAEGKHEQRPIRGKAWGHHRSNKWRELEQRDLKNVGRNLTVEGRWEDLHYNVGKDLNLCFSVITVMDKNYSHITHLSLLKIKYGSSLNIQESTSIYLSVSVIYHNCF